MNLKVKVIDPRQEGYGPLKLAQPVFSEEAIARAESTLETMASAFAHWLDDDLERLHAARLQACNSAWSHQTLDALWRAAHDLKGMGETYGYPLVTQLAGSLCRLLETNAGKQAARAAPALVEAHVDAARAAGHGRMPANDPAGRAVLNALEEQVRRLGVAPN